MTESNEEKANLEEARGEMYSFFSSLLLHSPTSDLVQNFLSEEGILALKAIFGDHPEMDHLAKFAQRYRRGEVKDNDLVLDYEQLFRVPGNAYVHPYESVYRISSSCGGGPGDGLVMGPAAKEVALEYELHGLSPREGFSELPDHLGVEMEFMAHLCRENALALKRGDDHESRESYTSQRDFLKRHLLSWANECLSRIEQKAGTPLYRNLSALLRIFLGEENSRLSASGTA